MQTFLVLRYPEDMFKPNPKKQVELKFAELFGKTLKPVVSGERVGKYYVTVLTVDGQELATAKDRDWRMAYKLLKLEVEKLFVEGCKVD